jgi:plastocyanin
VRFPRPLLACTGLLALAFAVGAAMSAGNVGAAPADEAPLRIDLALVIPGPDPADGTVEGEAWPPGDGKPLGSIRGRVVVQERPQRRVAERYPTAARGSARESPPVPMVVHLEGPALPRASAGAANRVRISQRDTTFVPGAAVVPVGTSVAFPNEDAFFHNVFSYSRAKRFDLGRFPQGESKSVVFDQPGYIKVFCEVHQWMRAGILVVAAPFHQVVSDDGTFHLEGVPPGRHTLVVTDFDRGTREMELNVPEGGEVQVRVEFGR